MDKQIDLNIVKYISRNTYYTNILLIPIILLLGILNYKIYDTYISSINIPKYKVFFTFSFVLLIIGTITSTIYHYITYFEKTGKINKVLYNIGLLDRYLTAPLIFLIFTILTINYLVYYVNKDNKDTSKSIEELLLFLTGVFYSIVGIGIYIYKSKYKFMSVDFITNMTNFGRINNEILHTLFHFTTYVGLLLILFVYYIEFDNITEWFYRHKDLTDIYFIISLALIVFVIGVKIYKYF